ncbi:MAG TPA: CBS domain-containing protein [Egibacteraceae bacterium]|jgi:CBS domain-containing protein|nr:CBS domain-containing protein [Egibacteraceae bacterium]
MARELPVTAVMTTNVITVTPDTSVEEAVALLGRHGISGAPVVDADGRLIGLLDDSDLIVSEARLHAPTVVEILGAYFPLPGERHRFDEEVRHALGGTVGEVMDDDPPWVGVDGTVEDVATLIIQRHVSRVPVLDADRRVAGIITRGDLVAAMGRGSP